MRAKLLVLSYSSDWLFPPEQSEELVRALLRNGVDASYVEIKSDYGHDAFLLEVERLGELTRDFLAGCRARGRPSEQGGEWIEYRGRGGEGLSPLMGKQGARRAAAGG